MEMSGVEFFPSTFDVVLRILKGAVVAHASDVHLRVGVPPMVRVEGEILPLEHPPVEEALISGAISTLMAAAGCRRDRDHGLSREFSVDIPDVGRFRAHAYRQKGTDALVLRYIPSPIPDLAALRIPPVAKRIALEDRGLVLVTGATGNGKSTTIAAMLDYMNRKVPKHVVTIEDPVEFVFDDDQCTFSQREVGRDVKDLGEGLRSAMREDPDVIFVGEIRAPNEFDVALTAAEAGHLIVSTFHSADSSAALMRMINLYPQDYRDAARQRVADAVTGIISQRLVPQRGTNQRVLIAEILRPTPTVQDCIRDPNRFRGIPAALEASTHEYGTQSFDQQLLAMVRDGLVSIDTARAAARSPKDLVRNLKLSR